jgi:hypothetical protein
VLRLAGLAWLCASIRSDFARLDERVKREMAEFKELEKKRREMKAEEAKARAAAAAAAAANPPADG